MYADHIARIIAAVASVPGILATSQFEPTSVAAAPHAYTMLTGATVGAPGDPRGLRYTYRTRVRVLEPYDENAAADTALWPFVNTIPAALLPLRMPVVDVLAGTYPIAGRACRALDLTVESAEWVKVDLVSP